MRINMMKFSDKIWNCDNALTYIFFSDGEWAFDDDYHKLMKHQLLDAMCNPDKKDWHELLEKEEIDLIQSIVESIGLLSFPFKITKESQCSPIAWVKLAMKISFTGILIANKFMRRYGKWRKECLQSKKLALVVQDTPEVKSTETSSTKNLDSVAYSIDVFLLTDIAKFDPVKYTYSILYKAISIDSKVPTQKISSEVLVKRQVGTGVYLEFQECITEAAKGRYIPNELRKLQNERRYIFSGSRLELLAILKEKFPGKLKYSDEVGIRAITEFAACGKYKRSK